VVIGNPFGTHFPYPNQFACVFTWSTSITSNLWTKLQDLIRFGEFAKNAKNLLYDN
jgi:hypothetical protein